MLTTERQLSIQSGVSECPSTVGATELTCMPLFTKKKNNMRNVCCGWRACYCPSAFIIIVLLLWQASCWANMIMQQLSAQFFSMEENKARNVWTWLMGVGWGGVSQCSHIFLFKQEATLSPQTCLLQVMHIIHTHPSIFFIRSFRHNTFHSFLPKPEHPGRRP